MVKPRRVCDILCICNHMLMLCVESHLFSFQYRQKSFTKVATWSAVYIYWNVNDFQLLKYHFKCADQLEWREKKAKENEKEIQKKRRSHDDKNTKNTCLLFCCLLMVAMDPRGYANRFVFRFQSFRFVREK